ncbi:MAG: hypothetical protein ABI186_01800 [Candidatus Elarobacter sp.]
MRTLILAAAVAASTLAACGSHTASSSNASNAAAAGAGTSSVGVSTSSEIATNPTDLPGYPNLSRASVMGGGKGVATLYNAASPDSDATVLAWYRSRLHGATEQQSGFVKDTITFSLPHGEQVVVQKDGVQTLIALGADAR